MKVKNYFKTEITALYLRIVTFLLVVFAFTLNVFIGFSAAEELNTQNETAKSAFISYHQQNYDVEGTYSVGKTSCKIKWSTSEKAFLVKWKKGSGYTYLFAETDTIYKEYDSDGVTYTGKFIFTDSDCLTGKYVRADGKVLKVKKL